MDEKVELLCSVENFEARAEDDGKCVFQGYAIKWGVEARIGSYFIEKFTKGCFSEAMKDSDWDVRFMVEHDGLPIARTKGNTLTIKEDATGLHFRAECDKADSMTNDLMIKINRGDVDGVSIRFITEKDEWDHGDETEPSIRTITRAKLREISAVTFPAHEATEIQEKRAKKVMETRDEDSGGSQDEKRREREARLRSADINRLKL